MVKIVSLSTLQTVFRWIGWLGWPYKLVSLILEGEKCAHTLFNDDFLDKPCLSLAISKTLSYALILGSCLYKIPIAWNIVRKKSGQGLNMTAMYLETSAIFANVIYCYLRHQPFTTYGDLIAVLAANIVIIALVWNWGQGSKKFSGSHILLVAGLMGIMIYGMFQVPSKHYSLINWYSTVVVTLSRLPQIISNATTGDIGVQSAITVGNAALGTAAKLFVVLVETPDFALFAGNFLAFLTNIILFFQIMFAKPKHADKGTKDTEHSTATKDVAKSKHTGKGAKGSEHDTEVKEKTSNSKDNETTEKSGHSTATKDGETTHTRRPFKID
jgi:mannose-P-dolichol utilization defect protein 1